MCRLLKLLGGFCFQSCQGYKFTCWNKIKHIFANCWKTFCWSIWSSNQEIEAFNMAWCSVKLKSTTLECLQCIIYCFQPLNLRHTYFRFCFISSYDYLKIYRGRRLIRRLSGRYSRYGRYRGGDDDDAQNDDDCDDDDDEVVDDYDNVNDNSKRTYGRYTHVRRARNRYGSRTRSRYGSRMRGRYRSPYVTRVFIRGTGEKISIIFKANRRNTGKGFYATYRVSRGNFKKKIYFI